MCHVVSFFPIRDRPPELLLLFDTPCILFASILKVPGVRKMFVMRNAHRAAVEGMSFHAVVDADLAALRTLRVRLAGTPGFTAPCVQAGCPLA